MTTVVVADSLLVTVKRQECPPRNKRHRCGSAAGLKMKRSIVLGFISMRSLLVQEVGSRFCLSFTVGGQVERSLGQGIRILKGGPAGGQN